AEHRGTVRAAGISADSGLRRSAGGIGEQRRGARGRRAVSLAAKSWCGGVGALLFIPAVATAQIVPAGTAADRAESTVVVANPSYSAAGAGRLLFGTHY